ncbi:hypothetical protein HY357_02770 [Candidatus Roizmanbacteria bacterium]|nr:hypothetical protein [Candidatus Roizmanbacteria bacterium]
MIDELLKKFGLKYEDLNDAEQETLNGWLGALQGGSLTTEKVREYIASMRESVETELTKTDHDNKQCILLKARLRNYMLLDAFLTSPEKAKKSLEAAISGIAAGAG